MSLQCMEYKHSFLVSHSDIPGGVNVDMKSKNIPLKNNSPIVFIIHGFTEYVNSTMWLTLINCWLNKVRRKLNFSSGKDTEQEIIASSIPFSTLRTSLLLTGTSERVPKVVLNSRSYCHTKVQS